MREICEILTLADTGNGLEQQSAGRIILDGNKLTYDAAPDKTLLMRRLLNEEMAVAKGEVLVSSSEQPTVWFHALPTNLTGTSLRARMIT